MRPRRATIVVIAAGFGGAIVGPASGFAVIRSSSADGLTAYNRVNTMAAVGTAGDLKAWTVAHGATIGQSRSDAPRGDHHDRGLAAAECMRAPSL